MALLMLLCAIWGVGQVAVKVGNSGISPLLGAGIRSAGSALLICLWAWITGVRLIPRQPRYGYGAVLALVFAAEFFLIFSALAIANVARATLFIYLAPFVVTIGAHFLLPGDRLRGAKLLGLVCAFTGLVIAFADGLTMPDRRELLGDVMALGGAVLWGASTLVIKARGAGLSPATTLFYQLAGSTVVLLVLSVASGEARVTSLRPAVVGAMLYQIVIVAFASFLAWFRMLERYSASALSAFSFWTPIFGAVASGVLLGEAVTPALAVSLVLVAAGIYLVNRR